MNQRSFELASEQLKQGGVIAYPTEAVWGIGCDPFNQSAVERILQLKNREPDKGLILVAANTDQLGSLLQPLTKQQRKLLKDSWPGPTTWLIPDGEDAIPQWIKGGHQTVAVRVSAHPVVQALCLAFASPIVSTSANRAGEDEIRSRITIEEQFAGNIDYIVSGELGTEASPSVIRDLVSGVVLR